jgi:hypothetical protein
MTNKNADLQLKEIHRGQPLRLRSLSDCERVDDGGVNSSHGCRVYIDVHNVDVHSTGDACCSTCARRCSACANSTSARAWGFINRLIAAPSQPESAGASSATTALHPHRQ